MNHPKYDVPLHQSGLPPTLTPPPPTSPPPNCTFAYASPNQLCAASYYSCGLFYSAKFDTDRKNLAQLKKHLELVVPQPKFTKTQFDDSDIMRRVIPGLIELAPGIPFAFEHTNLPHAFLENSTSPLATLETRVVFHTWDSLQEYGDGALLKSWLHDIEVATWGRDGEKPIWECGLKRNRRSDSSYTLAFTVEERNIGYLGAVKQTGNSRFHKRSNIILGAISHLNSYVLDISIHHAEREPWQTLVEMNNAVTFGEEHLWSNVQLNHSTGTGSLADAIGKVQGQIHTDPGDWSSSYTVFTLWVRFRKGIKLNAGAFMFAQTGVYLQDDQESADFPSAISDQYQIQLFIVVLKGNEPHSGFAPILHSSEQPLSIDREALVSLAPRIDIIDRVGFVSYLSREAIERYQSKTAVFPPSGFYGSTSEEVNARPDPAGTFTATHGLAIAPSHADHVHWHLREGAYMLVSRFASAGIRLDPKFLNSLREHAYVFKPDIGDDSYILTSQMDVKDLKLHAEGPPPVVESSTSNTSREALVKKRRNIQWNSDFCERSNLHVQRHTIKADRVGNSKTQFLPSGGEICGALQRAQLDFDPSDATPPTLFSKIISVTWGANFKVIYKVVEEATRKTKTLVNEHHHFLAPSHPNSHLLNSYLSGFHLSPIQEDQPLATKTNNPSTSGQPRGKKRKSGKGCKSVAVDEENEAERNDQGNDLSSGSDDSPSCKKRRTEDSDDDDEDSDSDSDISSVQSVRYANTSGNEKFLSDLISAGLSLENSKGPAIIEYAVRCIGDNFQGNLNKAFHSIITLAGWKTSNAWVQGWLDKSGTEILLHEISATAETAPVNSAVGGAIGSLDLLVESGCLLRTLSYEENKYLILSRIVRWLALSSLCHFYVWMTSKSGCFKLAESIYEIVHGCTAKNGNLSEGQKCACASKPRPDHALC